MNKIQRYYKAVAGLVGPAVITTIAAVQAASPGGSHITGGEWSLIAIAALGTGGLVAAFPANRPKRG